MGINPAKPLMVERIVATGGADNGKALIKFVAEIRVPPLNRKGEFPGVVGNVRTGLGDPAFYPSDFHYGGQGRRKTESRLN